MKFTNHEEWDFVIHILVYGVHERERGHSFCTTTWPVEWDMAEPWGEWRLIGRRKEGRFDVSPVSTPGFEEPQSIRYILKKVSRKGNSFRGKELKNNQTPFLVSPASCYYGRTRDIFSLDSLSISGSTRDVLADRWKDIWRFESGKTLVTFLDPYTIQSFYLFFSSESNPYIKEREEPLGTVSTHLIKMTVIHLILLTHIHVY